MGTILCLDDDKNVVNALKRELCQLGSKVLTATEGSEALKLITDQECAVIISDMRMRALDGAEFFRQVLELQPHSFRILLTGYADLEAVMRAINAGEIHCHLNKPWDANELARTVEQGLERYELVQANLRLTNELAERNLALEELTATLEKQLEERTQQVFDGEKLSAVGRLASGLVHEVCTPLAVVSGWVEMLREEEDIQTRHQASLEMMSEGINRAFAALEKLRDLSKSKVRAKQAININDLLKNNLGLVQHRLNQEHVILHEDLAEMGKIWPDKEQLSQVILNLINNALDAMNGGALIVRTRRLAVGEEGEMVEIDIADTGSGMSAEELDRVFEPFYTTKGEFGTGLGLPICRGIIKAHGGELVVKSEIGTGTTFNIRLPGGDPMELR